MQDLLAGRYLLGEELGRGGMARVVRARDLRLHRDVAVKLLTLGGGPATDPAVRARFVREARAAASFIHPHAVSVFDAGDADGALYLVMELVEGSSLATVLAHHGALGVGRSRELVDQVLQALSAAHRAGIVHRDVKPSNVLVTADGVAKLSDFGIAKRLDDLGGDLTMPGLVVGTPSSMAPEQSAGRPATPATDVYAAGVLLFQLLVDGPPFDGGSSLATALAHRDAPVPDVRARRPDVPADLAAVISRAMAKDPADRFASADEMRAAMGAQLPTPVPSRGSFGAPDERTSVATVALPTERSPAKPPPPPRTWWWWVAVAVALSAAALAVLLGRADDPPQRSAATSTPTPATPITSSTVSASVPTPTTPTTTTAPAASAAPVPLPTPTAVPTTVAEVIALIGADPSRFGSRAAELENDLVRIQQRRGRQLERDVLRLRARLADWNADGSIGPDVAQLVDSVLVDLLAGDDDDDDDDGGGDG